MTHPQPSTEPAGSLEHRPLPLRRATAVSQIRGRRRYAAVRLGALLTVAALGFGACSSTGTTTSAPGGVPQAGDVSGAAGAAEGKSALTRAGAPAAPDPANGFDTSAGAAAAPDAKAAADPVTEPKIVKNAALALTVEQIGPAAAKIRAAVAGFGGHVSNETVNATDTAPIAPMPGTTRADPSYAVPRLGNYGQLTFAVPADKLDAAMDAVAAAGTVVQRTSSSSDVTAVYVDTETRLTTKKASIERIRALMAQTQNISQVVELEGQLASREAELESLQAQLAALKDRVAMSTLTVVISTTVAGAVTPTPDTGFVAGLKSAWTAFLTSIAALLTALGAVLPWAIVLAFIAVPLWRRRRALQSAGMPRASVSAAPRLVGAGSDSPEATEATTPVEAHASR
jgi:hypothetical protein